MEKHLLLPEEAIMKSDAREHLDNTLSPSEISRLRSAEIPHPSGKVFNLDGLTVSWARHVDELKKHTETGSGDLPYWGAHDLVAAVILRDFAAEAHATIDEELKEKFDPILKSVDNVFISFTEYDEFDCVIAVEENSEGRTEPEREWWWHRIPTQGPIREDVRAYCNHTYH